MQINLSRDEVMAHEVGPMIRDQMTELFLDIRDFRHVETLYKQNPNKDNVDTIESKFYNEELDILVSMKCFDINQDDDWELKEVELDRYPEDNK